MFIAVVLIGIAVAIHARIDDGRRPSVLGRITTILSSGAKAMGNFVATLAISVLLFNLRRAGRIAERLTTSERPHAIQRETLDAACLSPLIAMLWLTACAMGSSDAKAQCLPVDASNPVEQSGAGVAVDALSGGAMVLRVLKAYAVMREHVCAG